MVSAFAISPPSYAIKATRGSLIHETVTLQKEIYQLNQDVTISVLSYGDLKDVFQISEPSFVIPAGQIGKVYELNGRVGENIPNGKHQVQVTFRMEDSANADIARITGEAGASAQVQKQLALFLDLDVTGDQITSYEFVSAKISNTEVGLPFLLTAQFKNTGTVAWKPDQIYVKLVPTEGAAAVYEFRIPVKKYVNPSATFDYLLEQIHSLPIGRYKGTATAVEQGVLTKQQEIPPFFVSALGTSAMKLQIKYVMSDRGVYLVQDEVAAEVLTENLGTIRTLAIVTVDLYRDDTKVDTQVSQPFMIEKADTGLVRFAFKNVEGGAYQIRAHVDYAGKTTQIALKDFSVVERPPTMVASKGGNLLDAISGSAQTSALLPLKLALGRVASWLSMSYCVPAPYWLIVLLLIIILILLITLLLNAYRRREDRLRAERLARIAKNTEQTSLSNGNAQGLYSAPSTPPSAVDPQQHDDVKPPTPPTSN